MNTYRINANNMGNTSSTSVLMQSRELRIGLLILGIVMLVLYVFQTSAFATRGYMINELERTLHTLKIEQKSMTVAIAEHTSMKSVEARLANSSLVPAGQVVFATPAVSTVALR